MKTAFFSRRCLPPLAAGGLVFVTGLFAGPVAYSAEPVSFQTASPFGKVDPQKQQKQQAELARLVAKLNSIQIVSLLTPVQKAELATLLGGLSNAERVTLLKKFYPTFLKLPQTLQDSILAQLAAVVPLPPPVFAHVLTFDEFPTSGGTVLNTQYQNLGVTFENATVYPAAFTAWPAKSGQNIAVSTVGLMSVTFDTAITGAVYTVSLYTSTLMPLVLRAYAASGALLAQLTVQPTPTTTLINALLSVPPSANPIARVEIEGSAGNYAIDNFSF